MDNDFIHAYNVSRLFKYFQENGLIMAAMIGILSYKLNDVFNEFYTNLIYPILNCEYSDKKKLEDIEIIIYNIHFKIGKMILALFKTLIIIYIVYIIIYSLKSNNNNDNNDGKKK